ncbi:MAG TPA: DUF1801 domain-containing protein [Candidatus Paceibacterota bacterium]|nr:DUF1801 domain-containing protein [Candidatus Paceibacterota bacterium]
MILKKPATVSEYISTAPKERQKKLREMRAILKKVVPKVTEEIKWGVPVFSLHRILFAYAAFKNSINFMPTPSAMKPFKKELSTYKTGKGSIQFSYDKPLPTGLIRKIAAFRVKELKEKDVRWM